MYLPWQETIGLCEQRPKVGGIRTSALAAAQWKDRSYWLSTMNVEEGEEVYEVRQESLHGVEHNLMSGYVNRGWTILGDAGH